MFKKNKFKWIISSLIILLPMLLGMIFWDMLPDEFAVHWGASGNVDGYESKPYIVFLIPSVMLLLHFICVVITMADPRNKEQHKKPLGLIFWIIPATTVLLYSMGSINALGKELNANTVMPVFIGILFIILGNYLPKIKRNSTLGIRTPWAIYDDVNWAKTHRFSSKLWVIGGILMMLTSFLPNNTVMIAFFVILIPLAVIPIIYSYGIFKGKIK